ncbi:hypothetical protein I551_2978 [Mycobacterium ulcerans str. Harvey]|uniref:Uncharacterized protein n=1 Tax=Mycobacterium ulcerans str. Harvey TaxID=1299332 RepID=A0ABN0R0R8_MYCUL|nr:hypothetical protein I551_2978 [Mycobacterium ulcerans str. Harvey]
MILAIQPIARRPLVVRARNAGPQILEHGDLTAEHPGQHPGLRCC